jgi:hypothetical protein
MLHEKWNANFFLASYALRSKVLFLVIVKKDPGSGKNSSRIQGLKSIASRIRIRGVKQHRIPDPQHVYGTGSYF